jgi:hypothetical protein
MLPSAIARPVPGTCPREPAGGNAPTPQSGVTREFNSRNSEGHAYLFLYYLTPECRTLSPIPG